MVDHTIKEGDTLPKFTDTLKDTSGDPIDLSNATVNFHMMRSTADSPKVDAVATIEDATNGVVSYTFSSGDTDDSGEYIAEWEIEHGNGDIQTIPRRGFRSVRVVRNIA